MSRFLVRLRESSRAWDAVLIAAGPSLNGRTYSPARLKAAVEKGLFDNRPIGLYRKLDASGSSLDHLADESAVGRSLRNHVGLSGKARFDESTNEVRAPIRLFETSDDAAWLDGRLDELTRMGGLESVGLSIDGYGDELPDGVDLSVVYSIDVVSLPAAGGRIGNRIAASRSFGGSPVKCKLLSRLRESAAALVAGLPDSTTPYGLAAHLSATLLRDRAQAPAIATALGLDATRLKEAAEGDLRAVIGEGVLDREVALATPAPAPAPTPAPAPAPAPAPSGERTTESESRLSKLEKDLALSRSRERLREAIEVAGLPAPSRKRLTEAHRDDVLDEAAVKRVVEAETAHVDQLARAIADAPVTVSRTNGARLTEALAHMFNPSQVKKPAEGADPAHGSFVSFVERHFLPPSARMTEAVHGQGVRRRLFEAIDSTNFDNVYEDAFHRATLAAYAGHIRYDGWRKLVHIVPHNDFRSHRVIKLGYYGTLPTVTKGAPYLTLTTPSDLEETIALAKKGGLEEILLEDILNDDLGLFQEMTRRIGQAAQETAYETVMSLIRQDTQPTMVDGLKLTSASRSPVNGVSGAGSVLSADATGKTNFINAVIGMAKGTGGSGQKKGVLPRYCVIPLEKLEAFSYVVGNLRAGLTGTDVPETMRQTLGMAIPEPVIDYGATGTGASTAWFLLAEWMQAEVLRFATLGGQQEPETFLADDQRFGNVFTHDKTVMKVRFIYGASAVDPLGIYGAHASS